MNIQLTRTLLYTLQDCVACVLVTSCLALGQRPFGEFRYLSLLSADRIQDSWWTTILIVRVSPSPLRFLGTHPAPSSSLVFRAPAWYFIVPMLPTEQRTCITADSSKLCRYIFYWYVIYLSSPNGNRCNVARPFRSSLTLSIISLTQPLLPFPCLKRIYLRLCLSVYPTLSLSWTEIIRISFNYFVISNLQNRQMQEYKGFQFIKPSKCSLFYFKVKVKQCRVRLS